MDDFRSSMIFALRVMADIFGTILIPAFVAAVLGQLLDTQFGTGRWIFAGLMIVAFGGTTVILVKKVRHYAKEYQKLITP